MNCTSARAAFAELLDHRTPPTAQLEARAHLASCPDCQREFAALTQVAAALDTLRVPAPSPRLRQNFYAMLEEEKHSATSVLAAEERRRERARTTGVGLLRRLLAPLAGVAALALAFVAGTRLTPPPSAAPADEATKQELAAVRGELKKMTQLVGYTLLQQQQGPANDRLRGVLASARDETPSDKVLDDLISALAFDPSANIRLRALEALYPHAERPLVRDGVLAALPREQNPLVQLELIDFVAAARARDAAPVLEKISRNEQADRTVRDAATRALAQL
jgi:hypothetical protein